LLLGSLSSIAALCAIENADRSRRLLKSVAQLLRYKYKRRGQVLPLADEIQTVEVLFALSCARYRDQLVTVIAPAADGHTDWNACYVPHYTILTFAENSIYHAFERTEPPWHVGLHVVPGDTAIAIVVEDDGIGFEAQDYLGGRSGVSAGAGDAGYGSISSTLSRLDAYYGSQYEIRIASSPGAGTRVELTLPIG